MITRLLLWLDLRINRGRIHERIGREYAKGAIDGWRTRELLNGPEADA